MKKDPRFSTNLSENLGQGNIYFYLPCCYFQWPEVSYRTILPVRFGQGYFQSLFLKFSLEIWRLNKWVGFKKKASEDNNLRIFFIITLFE